MKFNLAIIGCGKMGMALSYFSLLFGFNKFSLYDINEKNAIKLKINLEQQYFNLYPNITIGLTDSEYDVIMLALSGPDRQKFIMENFNLIKFKKNKIFVSLGRPNYEDVNNYFKFNQWLIQHSITLLFGLGLEPGLAEIMAKYLINKFQQSEINAIKIFCGDYLKIPNLHYTMICYLIMKFQHQCE